jgi:hypothetical protein
MSTFERDIQMRPRSNVIKDDRPWEYVSPAKRHTESSRAGPIDVIHSVSYERSTCEPITRAVPGLRFL